MTLSTIPSPPISSFSLGPLTIRFYAIFMLIAIVAAVWVTTVRWKKLGGTFDQIFDTAIVAVPCGIIGARLYHAITTPQLYFGSEGHFADIFKIWNGGLGIWGAVVLGGLGAWAWCRHRHYPMAILADSIAPALLIAQAIGRLGNYFNQELYGSCTDLPWGLTVTSSSYDNPGSCGIHVPFHPTFLYEMIWNLIGAAILIGMTRHIQKRFRAGSTFALYVMWYTLGRTWIEALRIDYAVKVLGLRVNIWVSICVFVAAAVAFVLIQRYSVQTSVLTEKLKGVTELEGEVQSGSMTPSDLRDRYKEENAAAHSENRAKREQKRKEYAARRAEYEHAKERVLARKKAEKEAGDKDAARDTETADHEDAETEK